MKRISCMLITVVLCFSSFVISYSQEQKEDFLYFLDIELSDKSITRQELAYGISKLFVLAESEDNYNFSDVDSKYEAAVASVVASGITSGVNDKIFAAHEKVSYKALVTFILRGLNFQAVGDNIYNEAIDIAGSIGLIPKGIQNVTRDATVKDFYDIAMNSLTIPPRGTLQPLITRLVSGGMVKADNMPAKLLEVYNNGMLMPSEAVAYAAIKENTETSLIKAYVTNSNEKEETYSTVHTIDGVECRALLGEGNYFYFDVDETLIRKGDKKVIIKVTYFDEGTDRIGIEYNTSDLTAPNAAYKLVTAPKTNSKKWKTVSFKISDAEFTGQQNNGGDFRINPLGAENAQIEYISRVEAMLEPITITNQSNVAFIDFSNDTVDSKFIDTVISGDKGTEAYVTEDTIDDVSCRKIENNMKYLYLAVDDSFAYERENILEITVRYYDIGSGPFKIQYNSSDTSVPEPNYKDIFFQRSNSLEWKTVTAKISDAKLINKQNDNCDMRMSTQDGTPLYINRIEIAKPKTKKSNITLGESDWANKDTIGKSSKSKKTTYAKVDGTELKAMMYYPTEFSLKDSKGAVVYMTYGSAMQNDIELQAKRLADLGIVVFVQEPVSGTFENQVVNAKRLIKYVKQNAGSFGVNPSRVAAAGYGEGGMFAALTLYKTGLAGSALETEGKPCALILISPLYEAARVPEFATQLGTKANNFKLYEICRGFDNVLIVQGGTSLVGSFENAEEMASKLSSGMKNYEYVYMGSEGDKILSLSAFENGSSVGFVHSSNKISGFLKKLGF